MYVPHIYCDSFLCSDSFVPLGVLYFTVAGTVSVSQYPPGVVDSGTSVQLGCAGLGAEITSVKWLRYKQTVKGTNLYDIKKVSTADSGLYTCSVTFAEKFKKKTKDIYLNVRCEYT